MVIRRLIRIVALLVCGVSVLAAAALFLTVPRPAVRFLTTSSAAWLMSAYDDESRLELTARRVFRAYVQYALAAQVAERALAEGNGRDEEILGRIVVLVQETVLNQRQVDHRFKSLPALVSGYGYCDQINGAVCLIAARHFDVVESFAVYDDSHRMTPHAIGRVWSRQRGEWLYFDAFFSVPIIYTKDAKGKAHHLKVPQARVIASRTAPVYEQYEFRGWPMGRFRRTFPAQLLTRWNEQRRAGRPKEEGPSPGAGEAASYGSKPDLDEAANASPPLPPLEKRDDEVFRRVARSYAAARMDHMLGTPSAESYRAIAADKTVTADERAAEIAAAAGQFARQLDGLD